MELQPGTYLQGNRYRIISLLGQGGFGITYLAEQVMAKRKVCIKEFFPKNYYKRDGDTNNISVASEGFAESMRRFKAKFIKEAQIIASLDHAHIIHIHDVFEENGTAYYVMEFIEGESLSALVKRCGALDEAIAATYIRHIADALDYIHEQKINHLDVKPGNIMVRTKDGNAILIDFGLAKHYDDGGDQTSSTPVGISDGYAPMEQYNAGGVNTFSPSTDIYSLGATLYTLVTGKVPPVASVVGEDGIGALPQHISPGIYATIEKSMNFWRKQRPQSIKEFLALLDGKGTVIPNIETTALHIEVADSKTELLPIVEPSKPAPPRQEIQPNNEIWYTSSDGNVVEPYKMGKDIFGAEIVSNTYKDGKGIIKFNGDVTTIGDYAFDDCESLTSVTIPNSVTAIGNDAFGGCNNLTSITIPNSVTTIGNDAFDYCNSLKEFKGKYAADGGRCLIKDNIIIAYANASGSTYAIPNSVTTIGEYAFATCNSLTSVTIPNSVTTIGGWAFQYCNNLTSVTIPNSVTTIGDYAFEDCESLTSVTIPNSVTTIGDGAFYNCNNLKSITIPNSVTTIGEWVFKGCNSLTSITIPNSVTTIGEDAFEDCESLTSVTIPNSVTTIGDNAFGDCKSLKEFKGKYAADGGRCLIKDNIIIAYANASGSTYAIPNSVTTIGEYAFLDCESLTSVTIPNSVTTIEKYAFYGCSSLKEFNGKFASEDRRCLIIDGKLVAFAPAGIAEYTIPNSVTTIGDHTFKDCDNLTSVTIPNSVTTIGEDAFFGCNLSKETKKKIKSINPYAF